MNLRVVHYQTGLCQVSIQLKHNKAKLELFKFTTTLHSKCSVLSLRFPLHSKQQQNSSSSSGPNTGPCLTPSHSLSTSGLSGPYLQRISSARALFPVFTARLCALILQQPPNPSSCFYSCLWSVPRGLPESLSKISKRSHYSPTLTAAKFPITLRIKFQHVIVSFKIPCNQPPTTSSASSTPTLASLHTQSLHTSLYSFHFSNSFLCHSLYVCCFLI